MNKYRRFKNNKEGGKISLDYTLEIQNILTNYLNEADESQTVDTSYFLSLISPLKSIEPFLKNSNDANRAAVTQNFSQSSAFVTKVFNSGMSALNGVDKNASGITTWFRTSFASITEGMGSLASTILSSLSKALSSAAKFIQGFIPTIRGFFNNLQHQTIFGIPLPTIFMWSVIACFVAWVFSKLAKMFSNKKQEALDFDELDKVFITEATDLPSVILKRVFSMGVSSLIAVLTSKLFSKSEQPVDANKMDATTTTTKTESFNMKLKEGFGQTLTNVATWLSFIVCLSLVLVGFFVFFNFKEAIKIFITQARISQDFYGPSKTTTY